MLERFLVLQHPMVRGELALGTFARRQSVLDADAGLPQSTIASHEEVLAAVEMHGLHGHCLSLVGAHLLVATLLTDGARLWTRDKRLRAAAGEIGVEYVAASTRHA